MFRKVKEWDNRKDRRKNGRLVFTDKGRSWTRRITWMENSDGQVKFKLEADDVYKEVLVSGGAADTIWSRFKAGSSIDDCIGILAVPVPKALASKKAVENKATRQQQ